MYHHLNKKKRKSQLHFLLDSWSTRLQSWRSSTVKQILREELRSIFATLYISLFCAWRVHTHTHNHWLIFVLSLLDMCFTEGRISLSFRYSFSRTWVLIFVAWIFLFLTRCFPTALRQLKKNTHRITLYTRLSVSGFLVGVCVRVRVLCDFFFHSFSSWIFDYISSSTLSISLSLFSLTLFFFLLLSLLFF